MGKEDDTFGLRHPM